MVGWFGGWPNNDNKAQFTWEITPTGIDLGNIQIRYTLSKIFKTICFLLAYMVMVVC